jgi:hypothetical protein
MYSSHQIEALSTGRLLACLQLAIDEALLVKSIIKTRKMIRDLKADDPSSERLVYFKKEIRCLKKKLDLIRSLANKKRVNIKAVEK